MAIHDSNPERRNLTILSLAIIIFYCADGEISDDRIRLLVVNMEFGKDEFLQYFLWIILFWFFFRYRLTNREKFKENYLEEITKAPNKIHINYYNKLFELDLDLKNIKNHIFEVKTNKNNGNIEFQYHQMTAGNNNHNSKRHIASSFSDYVHIMKLSIWALLNKPAISGYFVPYLLFFGAIILGANSWYIDFTTIKPTP